MIETIENYLYNRSENSVYFILVILILSMAFFDNGIIFSIGVVFYLFLNMKDIKEKVIQREEKNPGYFFYNETVHDLVQELRDYRRYNIIEFDKGSKYFREFFKNINNIERVEMLHVRHSFENAEYYLKRAINSFQSMTISVKEKSYEDHLKYPDKLRSEKIGRICKDLYKECYHILWNLSKKINEKSKDNLDRYKNYFHYDTSITESYDKYKDMNELY